MRTSYIRSIASHRGHIKHRLNYGLGSIVLGPTPKCSRSRTYAVGNFRVSASRISANDNAVLTQSAKVTSLFPPIADQISLEKKRRAAQGKIQDYKSHSGIGVGRGGSSNDNKNIAS